MRNRFRTAVELFAMPERELCAAFTPALFGANTVMPRAEVNVSRSEGPLTTLVDFRKVATAVRSYDALFKIVEILRGGVSTESMARIVVLS